MFCVMCRSPVPAGSPTGILFQIGRSSRAIFNFPDDKNSFINVKEISLSNHPINNFVLFPDDIVNIYFDPRDRNVETVSIGGAVYFPGNYPILSKNEKIKDIILRAGGVLPEAYPMASTFKRRDKNIKISFEKILNSNNNVDNFFVMPNDSIFISTKTNTVDVYGEINEPGSYKYFEGYNLSRYINLAGGLTVNAEKNEIWVTYPDGTSNNLKDSYLHQRY